MMRLILGVLLLCNLVLRTAGEEEVSAQAFTPNEFRALYELMVQYKYGRADNCPLVIKYDMQPIEDGEDLLIRHRDMKIGNNGLENCTDAGAQRVTVPDSLSGERLVSFSNGINNNLDKRTVFEGLMRELDGRKWYVSIQDSSRTCGPDNRKWFQRGETFFYFDESETIRLTVVAKVTGGEPKFLSLPLVGNIRYMIAVSSGTTCIYRVQTDVENVILGTVRPSDSPSPSPIPSDTPVPSPSASASVPVPSSTPSASSVAVESPSPSTSASPSTSSLSPTRTPSPSSTPSSTASSLSAPAASSSSTPSSTPSQEASSPSSSPSQEASSPSASPSQEASSPSSSPSQEASSPSSSPSQEAASPSSTSSQEASSSPSSTPSSSTPQSSQSATQTSTSSATPTASPQTPLAVATTIASAFPNPSPSGTRSPGSENALLGSATPSTTVSSQIVPLGSATPSASGSASPVFGIDPGNLGSEDRNTSTIDGTSTCFPGNSLVRERTRGVVEIRTLNIGEFVWTGREYSRVLMFTHRNSEIQAVFRKVCTERGCLLASYGHYIYGENGLRQTGEVRIGDILGGENVISVEDVLENGLFNPQTENGDIIINGFQASCYTRTVETFVAHAALTPVRAFSRLVPGVCEWLGSRIERVADGGTVGVLSV